MHRPSVAVLGVGAMGIAIATHLARSGYPIFALATEYDSAVVRAWRDRLPHPALGIVIDPDITVYPPEDWTDALARADLVVVAVSTPGLYPVLVKAAAHVPSTAVWVLATKGWQPESLLTPSQVAGVGEEPTKWSPSSTVTTNSVFDLLIPSSPRRLKNLPNALS